VGAKGGFVPKHLPPPSDRQAWMAEGIAAYREFVGTLLDLTDNLDGSRVVPPALTAQLAPGGRVAAVVRHGSVASAHAGPVLADGRIGGLAFLEVAARPLPGFSRPRSFAF
jgi:hypothetical protein